MPQRVFVILTPAAGRGRAARAWRTVGPALRDAGLSFDEVVEERPQLAIGLAEDAARRGDDVIAAVGGGGALPRGAGTPKDPLTAGRLLLNGSRRRVDIGRVNERYFVGISGVGFDAE